MTKLHLGCGRIRLPGYVNIDVQPYPSVDICADLRHLPFDSGSIDLIYSCAVIEHFGRREWQPVLAHWFDLLKPGSMLRLSTADFAACCAHYRDTGRVADLLGLVIGGQKDDWDWHGMIFDFALLAEGLEAVGFRNVRRYDWRDTDIGRWGIDDYSQAYLPHLDKANGRLMMLNVEADKPAEPRA